MSDELKMCAHCGAAMSGTADYWTHPENDCIFSGHDFDGHAGQAEKWNRRAPAAPAVQPDADPNAPWLTLAHAICTDAGVAHGFITDRLNQLRERIAPAVQEPIAWLHDEDGRIDVCHDKAKAVWLACKPKHVEHYTIPLYAAPVLAMPPGYALVPIEPTPEMLEPLARAWCNEHGIDPDAPRPPHGEYPNWYEHCGPYAEMWRTLLAAAPQSPAPQDVKDAQRYRLLRSLALPVTKSDVFAGPIRFKVETAVYDPATWGSYVDNALDAAIAAQDAGNGETK